MTEVRQTSTKPSLLLSNGAEIDTGEIAIAGFNFVEIDKSLVDAILNTIAKLELEVEYMRLKALFAPAEKVEEPNEPRSG